MDFKILIKRNSLILYFILAYAIAWGGILLLLNLSGFQIYQIFSGLELNVQGLSSIFIYIWIIMLAGPSISGVLLTGATEGKQGIKKLLLSILRWEVNIKWYLASLLLIPAVLLSVLLILSSFSTKFLPNFTLLMGILIGFMSGFFEEIGWTGFALPKLQSRYTPFVASIVLGFIHAIWHLLADYIGSINSYNNSYLLHFMLWIVGLIALRILIVWVYNHAKSLLLAQLTHASFTGGQFIFMPILPAPVDMIWYSLFVFSLLLVCIILVLKDKKLFLHKIV